MTTEAGGEVLAVRYGTVLTSRSGTFQRYEQYGEPDAPLRMDYFFWLVRAHGATVLVDTGFAAEVGRRRGRTCLTDPVRALAGLDVAPGDVDHIVVSHLHYDHIGNLASFPAATLSVARTELDFWTGDGPAGTGCADLAEPDEIGWLAGETRRGRVTLVDGDAEVAPGITVRLAGGHTPGQLVTAVGTGAGRVVLASDAVHFYEEMRRGRPHRFVLDEPAMRAAYAWLRAQERDGALVIAGHDPEVTARFETVATLDGGGSAVRVAA
jgi:glyoxylase-like metal-dependent hydrolase (beta-lactamase superfamily II)